MPTERKRIMTSYSKLSDELVRLFRLTYPRGYENDVITIQKPSGETIYAVRLETEDTSYLVRVEVKVDGPGDEVDDLDYGDGAEGLEGPDQYGDTDEAEEKGEEPYGPSYEL